MRQIFTISALVLVALTVGAAPALAQPAKLLSDTPWRDGPGTDYTSLGDLDKGTKVDAIWCGTHGKWCLIDRKGKKGWVLMSLLAALDTGPADKGDTGKPTPPPSGPTKKDNSVPTGTGSGGDDAKIADLKPAPPPTTLVVTTPPPLTVVPVVKLP